MNEGTITRRLSAVMDDLGAEFCFPHFKNEFRDVLKDLPAAKSNRPEILGRLYEMLDTCAIPYEKGRENHYYFQLVEQADLPTYSDTEDRILLALYRSAFQYRSPGEYLERTVDRLSGGEWAGEPLRLRILKRFIREGNYLSDVVELQYAADGTLKVKKDGTPAAVGLVGGRQAIQGYVRDKLGSAKKPTPDQILTHLDDGVFALLEGAPEAQKKLDGRLGLLKMTDDLAAGNFRTGGATRRSLYLFAMVYSMSFYTGAVDQLHSYESDVEKNLFRDYYSNNLVRFFSEAYRSNLAAYERDPSGAGINYKNFAEMVYLYYLSQDLPIGEKLRRSSLMIQRLRRARLGASAPAPKSTAFYRGRAVRTPGREELFLEDLMDRSEADFEAFLAQNYDCSVRRTGDKGDYTVNVLELAREQRTAFRHYQTILKQLEKLGVPRESCNYGLWFVDTSALDKDQAGRHSCWNRFARRLRQEPDFDPERYEQFQALLLGVNGFLGCEVSESASQLDVDHEHADPSRRKNPAMFTPGPEAITRTRLIVAYYYCYNALHEDDPDVEPRSFQTFFRAFRRELDPLLLDAGYMGFSGKHIFDLLVAFSAYAYCHTNL